MAPPFGRELYCICQHRAKQTSWVSSLSGESLNILKLEDSKFWGLEWEIWTLFYLVTLLSSLLFTLYILQHHAFGLIWFQISVNGDVEVLSDYKELFRNFSAVDFEEELSRRPTYLDMQNNISLKVLFISLSWFYCGFPRLFSSTWRIQILRYKLKSLCHYETARRTNVSIFIAKLLKTKKGGRINIIGGRWSSHFHWESNWGSWLCADLLVAFICY